MDRLSIVTEINFESIDKVDVKLKKLLNQLQEKNKLNIEVDQNTFNKIENQFNELKKKFAQSLEVNTDINGAGGALNEFGKTLDSLQKKQVKIIDGDTVQLIEQTKKSLIETEKIVTDLTTGKKTQIIDFDYTKNFKEAEKNLNSIYKLQSQMEKSGESTKEAIQSEITILQNKNKELYKQLDLQELIALKEKESININRLNSSKEDTQQNLLYKEASDRLNEIYTTKLQIVKTDQEDLGTIEILTNKINELNEKQSSTIGDINSLDKIIQLKKQEIEYENELDVAKSKSAFKNAEEEKSIQKQIELTRELMNIKLKNLQTKYGSLVNTDEVENFKKSLDNLNTTNFNKGEISNEFAKIETNTKASSSALRLAQKDASSFGDTLRHDLQMFGMWMLTGSIIMGGVNTIKDSISYMNQLNESQTNISVVTGMQMQKVQQLTNSYSSLAKQLGENNELMNKGAEIFLRAGLNEKDTQDMLKYETVASKLSGVGSDEMSNYLIAIKNGFHLEVDEIGNVIDALSTLDNKSSTSFADISESMQRTSSSANQVGIDYKKLASYVSTVADITHKSAETIGESYRAIFMRMENVKAGMKDEDQMGINDVEKVLSSDRVNIKLRETSGEWRNMGNVISEIASKWSSFDKVTQSQISTAVAGQRQAETFLTLMQNWDKEQQYEQDILGSQGSSWERYQTYLDSTSAKLNILKTTIHDMFTTMVNSKFINTTIEDITKLISTFGNLKTIISLIGTGFAVSKGAEIFKFLTSLPNTIMMNVRSLNVFKVAIGALQLQEEGLITTTEVATLTFRALGDSIKASMISNPLGWIAIGISAVVMAVDAWNSRTQKQIDQLNELSNKIQQEQSDIKDLKSSLSTLDELHSKTVMTNDDKTQLKNINDQLAEKYPELISYYDKESQSFQVNIDKLKELIKKKQELAMQENANNLQSAKDSASQAQKAIDDDKNSLASNKKYVYGNSGRYERDLTAEDRNKLFEEVSKNEDILAKSNQIINQATKYINDYIAEQTKAGISVEKINNELLKYGYTQNQIDNAIKMSTNAIKEDTKAQEDNAKASQKNVDSNQAYSDAVKTFSDNLSKAKTDISDINQVLDDYHKSGELNLETIIKLSDSYPQLLGLLGNEKALEQELIKIKNDRVNSAKDALTKQIQNEQNYLNEIFKGYNTDVDNFKSSEEAKLYYANTYAQRLATINEAIIQSETARQTAIADGDREAYELAIKRKVTLVGVQSGIKGQIDQVSTHIDNYFKLKDISLNADKLSGTGSTANDGKGSVQDTAKKAEELRNQMKSDVKDVESQITDIIKKEFDERKKAVEDEFNKRKETVQKVKALYNKQNSEDDYNKKLKTEQDKLNSIKSSIASTRDTTSEAGKLRLRMLQEQEKEQQQAIDDMVLEHTRSLNNDMFDAQMQELDKEKDAKQKALEEQYSDENIAKMVNQSLITGQITGIGNVLDAYLDFQNKYNQGLTASGKLVEDEFVNKWKEIQSLINGTSGIDIGIDFKVLPRYANGGVVEHTGLAYVDGTKSDPELMVNGKQAVNILRNFAINPLSFTPKLPNISSINKNCPSVQFNEPFVVIQGNVDKSVDLDGIISKATDNVTRKIMQTFNNYGIYEHL